MKSIALKALKLILNDYIHEEKKFISGKKIKSLGDQNSKYLLV